MSGFGSSAPEVLDTIFSYVDDTDIKTCRLVCHHWRNAVQHQLNARVRVRLEEEKNVSGRHRTLEEVIESTRPEEFSNVIVVKAVPVTFQIKFKRTLRSLFMKDITFHDLNDARRILFNTFESLREVGFENVLLSANPIQGPSIYVAAEYVPNVEKLKIRRQFVVTQILGVPRDLFETWNFGEIINTFSSSLKELDLHHEPGFVNRHNIWETLTASRVCLMSVTYWYIQSELEFLSFLEYMESHGHRLQILNITSHYYRIFGPRFNAQLSVVLRPVKYAMITNQHWDLLPEDGFPNMKYLVTDQLSWTSFRFFMRMPNLRTVEMSEEHEAAFANFHGVVCPNVKMLILKRYSGNKLDAHSHLFPSIEKLVLREAKDLNDVGVFEAITEGWPHLKHLELSGKGWAYWLGAGDFSRLNRVGNESPREYDYLLRFTELVSYVHNDEYSRKQIRYGDYTGGQIFGSLPCLRTLRLGNCCMSENVLRVLKDRLFVFTYEKGKNKGV